MPRGPLNMLRFYRDHRWTRARLSEYLDGELDPPARERVERHTGMCPDCRRLMATLKRTLVGLLAMREDERSDIADSVIDRLRSER